MSLTSADTPSFAGSSILRQSPPFHSLAHTGPGGADLSLSELYISDRSEPEDGTPSKPFSLLPQLKKHDKKPEYDGNETARLQGDHIDEAGEDTEVVGDKGKRSLNEARTREERLQHDLFVLRKLNASFSLYNDALKDTKSSTESVALQLDRTDRLLDQYVNLLRHTESNSKLIFDEGWEGGVKDQEILDVEAAQRAQREREEYEEAARMERERLEKQEQEQKAKVARNVKEGDKVSSGTVQGIRGVKALRARGAERGTSTATRGRIPGTSSSATISKGGVSVVPSRSSKVSRGGRRS